MGGLPLFELEGPTRAKFEAYHAENPHIYAMLVKFAFYALNKGCKRLAIELLYNRVRWETDVEAEGDPFKLNNNYKSFYVRKLIAEYPQFDDMFERRKSIADDE